jgi:predicted nucleic acid-binding protein
LYAFFVENDAHHGAAVEAVRAREPILVPVEILTETLGVLQLRHGFQFARSAGEFLRTLPHVEFAAPDATMADASWALYLRGKGKVSHADSVVVAWCFREGAEPLAFDRALKRLASAKVS